MCAYETSCRSALRFKQPSCSIDSLHTIIVLSWFGLRRGAGNARVGVSVRASTLPHFLCFPVHATHAMLLHVIVVLLAPCTSRVHSVPRACSFALALRRTLQHVQPDTQSVTVSDMITVTQGHGHGHVVICGPKGRTDAALLRYLTGSRAMQCSNRSNIG